jgi:D-xylose 1-dehydrogenase (NADP+, D-xylono-1,5-lactone-forming)
MKKVRFGIIGGGEIAFNRARPGLKNAEGVDLVAMADVSPQSRERWAQDIPGLKTFDDADKLLADKSIDAVYVALPNCLHKEWTIRAAKRGKHVICEKPMAMTAGDAAEMVQAAERSGVKLMAAYMMVFNPLVQALHAYVKSGQMGRILYAHGQFSYALPPAPGIWRMDPERGGGPMFDIGIYLVLTIRYITGKRFKSVSAVGTNVWWLETSVPDTVVVAGELEDGTPVSIESSFTHGGNHVRFEGEHGTITLDEIYTQRCEGRMFGAIRGVKIEQSVEPWVFAEQNYQREFEHFARCIVTGEEPVSSGRVAMHDCAVLDAVVKSIRTKAQVAVA